MARGATQASDRSSRLTSRRGPDRGRSGKRRRPGRVCAIAATTAAARSGKHSSHGPVVERGAELRAGGPHVPELAVLAAVDGHVQQPRRAEDGEACPAAPRRCAGPPPCGCRRPAAAAQRPDSAGPRCPSARPRAGGSSGRRRSAGRRGRGRGRSRPSRGAGRRARAQCGQMAGRAARHGRMAPARGLQGGDRRRGTVPDGTAPSTRADPAPRDVRQAGVGVVRPVHLGFRGHGPHRHAPRRRHRPRDPRRRHPGARRRRRLLLRGAPSAAPRSTPTAPR
jgi:hypothetical protein